jgi:hypothetical protein
VLRQLNALFKRIGPRTSAYAAVVTLLGLFAGLLGSLYADDIKAAFPFVIGNGPVSRPAALFWIAALATTLMFFFGQRAAEAERKESETRLDLRSAELSRLIRTLPPSDFLSTFRKIFWDCGNALVETVNSAPEELTREAIEGAIRIVLFGVATLAQKFDAAAPDVVYAANIMLFRPAINLSGNDGEKVRANLRFLPTETDLRALRGVLILERTLSTTTASGSPPGADDSLTPLALPVPTEIRDQQTGRWKALPGAPMAFSTGGLEAYVDTLTLGAWCRREGDFPESIAAGIDEYFRSNRAQSVRSFISIAIKPLRGDAIGVLNIHRNQPGLLEEKEPVQQFAPLVSPFVFVLIRLLELQGIKE